MTFMVIRVKTFVVVLRCLTFRISYYLDTSDLELCPCDIDIDFEQRLYDIWPCLLSLILTHDRSQLPQILLSPVRLPWPLPWCAIPNSYNSEPPNVFSWSQPQPRINPLGILKNFSYSDPKPTMPPWPVQKAPDTNRGIVNRKNLTDAVTEMDFRIWVSVNDMPEKGVHSSECKATCRSWPQSLIYYNLLDFAR